MLLADTLSRAYPPHDSKANSQSEFETVNAISYLPMRSDKIEKIRAATEIDQSLQALKVTIQQGWPDDKSGVDPLVIPYFHVRDELALSDGLVFRGERLVIPASLLHEMKQNIHVRHTGVALHRARESISGPV